MAALQDINGLQKGEELLQSVFRPFAEFALTCIIQAIYYYNLCKIRQELVRPIWAACDGRITLLDGL